MTSDDNFPELRWTLGIEWIPFRWWRCVNVQFAINFRRPAVAILVFGMGCHIGLVRLKVGPMMAVDSSMFQENDDRLYQGEFGEGDPDVNGV